MSQNKSVTRAFGSLQHEVTIMQKAQSGRGLSGSSGERCSACLCIMRMRACKARRGCERAWVCGAGNARRTLCMMLSASAPESTRSEARTAPRFVLSASDTVALHSVRSRLGGARHRRLSIMGRRLRSGRNELTVPHASRLEPERPPSRGKALRASEDGPEDFPSRCAPL